MWFFSQKPFILPYGVLKFLFLAPTHSFPKRCQLKYPKTLLNILLEMIWKVSIFPSKNSHPLNPFQNTAYISHMPPQFFLKYNISFPFPSKVSIDPKQCWSLLPSSRNSFSKRWPTFFLFYISFPFSYVGWIFLITWLHSFLPYVCSLNQYGSHPFRVSHRGYLLIFPLVDFPTKFQS